MNQIGVDGFVELADERALNSAKVLALNVGPLPSSLLGAAVFFGLLTMLGWLLIKETLRIVLKPALVFMLLALLAVWAGILDGTVVEEALSWMGDHIILAASAISEWAVGVFETAASGSAPGDS